MSPDSGDAATRIEGEWPREAEVGIVVPTYRRAEYLTRVPPVTG
jgi:hypothetical protein